MRFIFISLVVANLAVAIWGVFLKGAPDQAAIEAPQSSSVSKAAFDGRDDKAQDGTAGGAALSQDGVPLCELVGPFPDNSVAEDFVDRLLSIDVKSKLQTVELPAGSSFWVHLAPEESREAAFRRLAELQAQGVESYVIGSGELKNAISLGVFTVENLANVHVEKLKPLGLEAIKTEFERQEIELWVEIQAEEAKKMSESTWSRMLKGLSSQERRQNYCLPVAS